MNRTFVIFGSLAILLMASLWWIARPDASRDLSTQPLVVHCAAGLRIPVSEIAEQYEKNFGVPIHLQFGGSGALETQLEIAGGDLFLPADISYINSARKKGLLRESIPVARLTAGIVVPKGNPKQLNTLNDLSKSGIRISLAERSAAIGRHTWGVLETSHVYPQIEANVIVTKPTVNNIIEDVATGAVDASIAWDAVASSFPEVEWIALPEFQKHSKHASIGVLESAKDATRALHFARVLTAHDRGAKVFADKGFKVPTDNDLWAENPQLTLFSGSMLRPAIQERLRQFEEREGCRIDTIFEGCGTLVAMMKDGGGKPAAYFSCDTKFLDMVADRFEPGTVVSGNEIILLVPKGNPRELNSLKGLLGEDLKIGLCNPEKSALGHLTRLMLDRRNVGAPLDASGNVALLAGKGDDLVNAMQARSLDAALVYRSNALASEPIREHCEIINLNDPLALATQPFAVARDTDHPQLSHRLGEWLSAPDARQRFEDLGFTWKRN